MISIDTPTTNIDLPHYIQRQIIICLRQDVGQSYQNLKPDGVGGDAFNYHLRYLKSADFIQSDEEKYTPTQLV